MVYSSKVDLFFILYLILFYLTAHNMNVAKQLFRQPAHFTKVLKVVPSALLRTTGLQQFTHGGLKPAVLQPCLSLQSSISRHMSSTQSCKFEVINVQDEDDFKKRVLESDIPVIVDFHAT